jgi:hypothetical protein
MPRASRIFVTINGETLSLKEWSRRTGIGYPTLKQRYDHGWPLASFLTPPAPFKRVGDLTGQQIGEWTILGRGPNKQYDCGQSIPMWRCRCSCGEVRDVNGHHLVQGRSRFCAQREHWVGKTFGKKTIYGLDLQVYLWRCNDCGHEGRNKQLSDLTKWGCKGCDPPGRVFTFNGESHNLAGWAKKVGITREAMRLRVERGVPPEQAFVQGNINQANKKPKQRAKRQKRASNG